MTLQQEIHEISAALLDEAIAIRRYLHQHPELSFEEKETSAFLSSLLTQFGISHQTNVTGYGIVGIIEGKNPSKKCIALRADMDALPIRELSDKVYRSQNEGIMHACGHDAHSTILLMTARVLQQMADKFEGTVKLLFQPAEE